MCVIYNGEGVNSIRTVMDPGEGDELKNLPFIMDFVDE